jgi:hypothetical protein
VINVRVWAVGGSDIGEEIRGIKEVEGQGRWAATRWGDEAAPLPPLLWMDGGRRGRRGWFADEGGGGGGEVEARGEEDKSGAWKDDRHPKEAARREEDERRRGHTLPLSHGFFSILTLSNYFLRNEPGGNFFFQI